MADSFPKVFSALRTILERNAGMQGKSCFNFTSVDEPLFAELEELRVRTFEAFGKLPFMR